MGRVPSPAVRLVVRLLSSTVLAVAVVATGAGWLGGAPELDSGDAVDTAVGALESVGVSARLADTNDFEPPRLGVHRPSNGDPVDAWFVFLSAGQDTIEVRVQETVGQLVYIDDRVGPDGQERALTDEQYERLGDYRDDTVLDRWIRRNVLGTVAALVIVVVTVFLPRAVEPSDRTATGSGDLVAGPDPETPIP